MWRQASQTTNIELEDFLRRESRQANRMELKKGNSQNWHSQPTNVVQLHHIVDRKAKTRRTLIAREIADRHRKIRAKVQWKQNDRAVQKHSESNGWTHWIISRCIISRCILLDAICMPLNCMTPKCTTAIKAVDQRKFGSMAAAHKHVMADLCALCSPCIKDARSQTFVCFHPIVASYTKDRTGFTSVHFRMHIIPALLLLMHDRLLVWFSHICLLQRQSHMTDILVHKACSNSKFASNWKLSENES